jgi:alpha-methylacyl-CoA racemase
MGPLSGVRVIEMAGIGPGPFCGMLLADMGADVVRVDRLTDSDRGVNFPPRLDLLNRNKRSIAIDLKSPQGLDTVNELIKNADVLLEGFRPGVMEKLGLGPRACVAVNPKLVYGRITGWGQDGPLAQAAGHELNYIALSGALEAIGSPGKPPTIPLNLIGDFGGGALYLAMGVLAAVIEARSSGTGQVVDAAIVDGVNSLMTMQYALKQMGAWPNARGSNLLDGGAPFYSVYETKDGHFISIAPVEKRFYEALLERLELSPTDLPKQNDARGWEQMRSQFGEIFKSRTRAEWCDILEGTDACFAPVLNMDEVRTHPHNVARQMFVEVDGVLNPAPAPRFSRTVSELTRSPPHMGADTEQALLDWGLPAEKIIELRQAKVIP